MSLHFKELSHCMLSNIHDLLKTKLLIQKSKATFYLVDQIYDTITDSIVDFNAFRSNLLKKVRTVRSKEFYLKSYFNNTPLGSWVRKTGNDCVFLLSYSDGYEGNACEMDMKDLFFFLGILMGNLTIINFL